MKKKTMTSTFTIMFPRLAFVVVLMAFLINKGTSFTPLTGWYSINTNTKRLPRSRVAMLNLDSSPLSSGIERLQNLRDNLETPAEPIIAAVSKLPANQPLSVGDAASLAGVDLNTARNGLMTLASLTGGDLLVTKEGEILYSFPPNVRSILQQRSLGQKMKNAYTTVYPILFYALRATFGIALLTSLALLLTTFIVVSSGGSSDDNDNKNRNRSNVKLPNGILSGDMFDVFYYRPYYGYYQSPAYVPDFSPSNGSNDTTNRKYELSFIETFFSYVFGDGNPNVGFSNEQLACIAQTIRDNGGVVVAEQLAPFLDPPDLEALSSLSTRFGAADTSDEGSVVVDESWVLPAVVQLGGMPIPTPDGNIVYRFEALSKSASNPAGGKVSFFETVFRRLRGAPRSLEEKEIPFSAAQPSQIALAGALGALNLGGAVWLGKLLGSGSLALAREPVLAAFLTKAYPPLLAYALMYNLVPAVRWVLTSRENAAIRIRNKRRKEWASQLTVDDESLKQKIRSAKKAYAVNALVSGGDSEVVYSTRAEATKMADELTKTEDDVMAEFDKRLSEQSRTG